VRNGGCHAIVPGHGDGGPADGAAPGDRVMATTATGAVMIHAGAHKTGTTSLQTLFTRHRDELASHGILYPRAGVRPHPHGIDVHTNLAWELIGHGHYSPAAGGLDDVVDEIAASDCRDVLLSSEEFACLVDRPEQLGRLRSRLEDTGRSVHVVLVLRDPRELAESLYVTLVGYGLDLGYDEYLAGVTEHGRVEVKWNTYCFDNDVLVRSFAEVFGEDAVTCVDYDPTDAVRPVLGALDWFLAGALDAAELDLRANTTGSRVEELRARIRDADATIAALESRLDQAERDGRRLRAELAWSEARFSRRVERKVRHSIGRHRTR
jgi:hypothetical protein